MTRNYYCSHRFLYQSCVIVCNCQLLNKVGRSWCDSQALNKHVIDSMRFDKTEGFLSKDKYRYITGCELDTCICVFIGMPGC